jgi:hypothetical protein
MTPLAGVDRGYVPTITKVPVDAADNVTASTVIAPITDLIDGQTRLDNLTKYGVMSIRTEASPANLKNIVTVGYVNHNDCRYVFGAGLYFFVPISIPTAYGWTLNPPWTEPANDGGGWWIHEHACSGSPATFASGNGPVGGLVPPNPTMQDGGSLYGVGLHKDGYLWTPVKNQMLYNGGWRSFVTSLPSGPDYTLCQMNCPAGVTAGARQLTVQIHGKVSIEGTFSASASSTVYFTLQSSIDGVNYSNLAVTTVKKHLAGTAVNLVIDDEVVYSGYANASIHSFRITLQDSGGTLTGVTRVEWSLSAQVYADSGNP